MSDRHYEDYFRRICDADEFDNSFFDLPIPHRRQEAVEMQLLADCLSNHVEISSSSVEALKYNPDSNARLIDRDILTAYFINKIYSPPRVSNYPTIDGECDPADFDRQIEASTGRDDSHTESEDEKQSHYWNFLAEACGSSFVKKDDNKLSLGTNKIRFVVGDVGEGKTAFLRRVQSDIARSERIQKGSHKLIPVYINLEKHFHYGEVPEDLDPKFLSVVFESIYEAVYSAGESQVLDDLGGMNPTISPRFCIKKLCSHLECRGVRLALIIDNLDFYEYYYTRYAFIPKYNREQDASIRKNILWLKSELSEPEKLGDLGLSVMIAARKSVYDNIMSRGLGTDTDQPTSKAITLEAVSDDFVVGTRLELLSDAITEIAKNKPGSTEILRSVYAAIQLKTQSDEFLKPIKRRRSVLSVISGLGQHGHRSFVKFLSTIHVSYLERELIERFFERQVSSLYTLYYTNHHLKYSQAQNHFPNVFLCDCTASSNPEFSEAHQTHNHTYWLKYILIRLIHVKIATTAAAIVRELHENGPYEKHLIQHALGSLMTSNEFCCIRFVEGQVDRPFELRKMELTLRGRLLCGGAQATQLCFSFEYLSALLDDKLLCIPNICFEKIFRPESCYSIMYDTSAEYLNNAAVGILKKCSNILWFVCVLRVSLEHELKGLNPPLVTALRTTGSIPEIIRVKTGVLHSARNLLAHVKPTIETEQDLKDLVGDANNFEANCKKINTHLSSYFENPIAIGR